MSLKLLLNTWNTIITKNNKLDNNDKIDNNVKEIILRLSNSGNIKVRSLGNELLDKYKNKKERQVINNNINQLILEIADIGTSKKTTKLNISENNYQILIKKKQTNIISEEEKKILDKALFIKVCNCVKKKLSQNTAKWLLGEINSDIDNIPYNPYAICTSSIYNKRGFKREKSFKKC